METLSLHELHKICRICLKSDILASIYSPTFLIRPIEMLQKLHIFKADDGLPSLLCQSCLYRLLDAYNLQQLAEASERRLKEYFGVTSASCSAVSNLVADVSVTPIMPSHATTNIDLIKPEGDCSPSSMYANICDMMFDRHDVTNDMVEVVGGTDDVELLNDVEIDVSSLTRSEADENTLGDVFATKSRLTMETSFVGNRLNGNFKLQDHNSQLHLFGAPTENKITDLSLSKHKKMTSIKSLRKSLKTPDECLECGKIFPYKGYLEIHKRVHSGEKPFKCQICPREFITSTKLLLHQRSTHNNIFLDDKLPFLSTQRKRFQCEICSAFFATSSNLKSHKFAHSDKRNYPCQHCMVSFKSPRDLKRHEPMHKTIRDIFCGMCDKSFTKRTSLSAHMITVHRRIRKHECSECNKVFGKKSNLINHMRIHSGEKPFQCPSCSWKFAQSSALRRHMKKHQTQRYVFPFAFVLMSNKKQKAYQHVLQFINSNLLEMKPKSFTTDFENGMRNAIKTIFPECRLKGCWFHFCQAWRRRALMMKDFGSLIKRDTHAKQIFQKLMAIPLLEPKDIIQGFNIIQREAYSIPSYRDAFEQFLTYFEKQWIEKETPQQLSLHNENVRTTSALEGYNSYLSSLIPTHGSF